VCICILPKTANGGKKAQPTAAQNSFLPPENIWFLLRKTKEKRALDALKFPEKFVLGGILQLR